MQKLLEVAIALCPLGSIFLDASISSKVFRKTNPSPKKTTLTAQRVARLLLWRISEKGPNEPRRGHSNHWNVMYFVLKIHAMRGTWSNRKFEWITIQNLFGFENVRQVIR